MSTLKQKRSWFGMIREQERIYYIPISKIQAMILKGLGCHLFFGTLQQAWEKESLEN